MLNILALTMEYGFWNVYEIIPIIETINLNISFMIKIEEMITDLNMQLEEQDMNHIAQALINCRRHLTVTIIQVKFLLKSKR